MTSEKKGNLLLVSNYPSNTAYAWWLMEHFWISLASRLEKEGRQTYLSYPEITTIPKTITEAPIQAIELNMDIKNVNQALLVRSFVKEHNITSIYFTDQPFFNVKYAFLRLIGINKIIIHDHTPGDRPPVTGVKGFLKSIKNSMRFFTADNMFCVSELMRNRNITNGKIPYDRCSVVQNGINPIQCDSIDKNAKRVELGLSPGGFAVVTTGRAHPAKRFDFVIHCAAITRKEYQELDIKFLLVGDGPAMQDLKNTVKDLELTDYVYLLGFRDDVRELLCACDAAFHAATGEGFSLSILEYMSAGLPVLVPDIPSVSQAIEHNVNGFIYQPDDHNEVASLIKSLATNRTVKIKLGEAAHNCASSQYTLERCTHDFLMAAEKSLL